MKVVVTRLELERCGSYDAFLELIAGKGIDLGRGYAFKAHVSSGDMEITQEDLKKARSSGQFGYCWSCKEVVELAGEHCSDCRTWITGCFRG